MQNAVVLIEDPSSEKITLGSRSKTYHNKKKHSSSTRARNVSKFKDSIVECHEAKSTGEHILDKFIKMISEDESGWRYQSTWEGIKKDASDENFKPIKCKKSAKLSKIPCKVIENISCEKMKLHRGEERKVLKHHS